MKVENSIVKQEVKPMNFGKYLSSDGIKARINELIGGKDGQRFITSIISAVNTNPALANCDNASILSCALLGESLKLSPSPQLGYYYMLPFNDKKKNKTVATFILGWKGYIQLAIRSGEYKRITCLEIKEGELKKYNPLKEEIVVELIDDFDERENAKTVGYFAEFELLNGFTKSLYWTTKQMLNHADRYSKAFNKDAYLKLMNGEISKEEAWKYSSYWYQNFDMMALKTLIKQLFKYAPMSVEMREAYIKDESIIEENGESMYIEDVSIDEVKDDFFDEVK